MVFTRAFLLPVSVVATLALSMLQGSDAHGFMAVPYIRPITATFRASAPGQWKDSKNEEVWRAPLGLFTGGSANFDINNGCRGMVFEPENPVAELTPGKAFDVVWLTQASHPGPVTLSVARPSKNGTRTVWVATESVPMVRGGSSSIKLPSTVNSYGRTDAQATLPASLTGCNKPGDCTLQWWWDASAINQQYYNCADFIVTGGAPAAGNDGDAYPAPAPAATTTAPTPSNAPVTTAPAPAPATTTKAPAPAPAVGNKCTRKRK